MLRSSLRFGSRQSEYPPQSESWQRDWPDLHRGLWHQDQNADQRSYKTGSIWIDPATHLIMTKGAGGSTARSPGIYAVGAMTRGQIIDASMAYGIARSTAKIAQDLVDALKPNARQNTGDK